MKRIVREDFRVRVAVVVETPAALGLPVEGRMVTDRLELVVEPKRLGDLGCGIIPDSLLRGVRDPQAAYERRAEEMASELRCLPQVVRATVECTESATCSHCGRAWEEVTQADLAQYPLEGDELGLPVCCEQAQVEWRAAQKAGVA